MFIHLGASVNKSHIPSLPQNNLYVLRCNFFQCHIFAMRSKPKIQIYSRADIRILGPRSIKLICRRVLQIEISNVNFIHLLDVKPGAVTAS